MLIKLDPPLDFARPLPAAPRLPGAFPFAAPSLRLYFSGRYALFAALRALGLPRGAEVLLPAYNCGTEVEPCLRAGLKPRFYRVGRDLACDLGHIEEIVRGGAGPRALVLTHYFGLPQPVAEAAALCRALGVSLIEDCAHALLGECGGRPLGSWGAAGVFSLVKSLPLPDGGALVLGKGAAAGAALAASQNEPPAAVVQHILGRLLRHNHPGEGGAGALWRLGLERVLAGRRRAWELVRGRGGGADPRSLAFEPEVAGWTMSALSRRILATLDLAQVKAARRRNFQGLLECLASRRPECLVVGGLPEGACPLVFPVRVRRPPELFAGSLARRGVEAWPWWHELFHPAVPWKEFGEARALKRRVLALPIHQGLGEPEIDRIAAAFEAAWRFHA